MLTANRLNMSKPGLLRLLEEMQNNSGQTASLCLPPQASSEIIRSMLSEILNIREVSEDLIRIIADSPTGAMVFWGSHHRYLVMPPFPVHAERVSGVCEIEPLYSLLHRPYLIALVLIRAGAYGIGVYKGEELLSSKVGTGLVHARHRQGGSSAHRFERHRDKQLETFFTRVCQHARQQLEPYVRQIEFLLYGGTRENVLEFRKQCHFLQEFDKRTLQRLLNIREPKQAGLVEAIRQAWSSQVIRWNE